MSKEIAYNLERPPYCAGCGAPMPRCSCDEVPAGEGTLGKLRAVWSALGCEQNPDDFKTTVQESMWSLALDMIRKATTEESRVYRENIQLATELQKARAEVAGSDPTDHSLLCDSTEWSEDGPEGDSGRPCDCYLSRAGAAS